MKYPDQPSKQIRIKTLLYRYPLHALGTEWSYLELPDEELFSLGERVRALSFHLVTEDRTPLHAWRLVAWHGSDDQCWGEARDLGPIVRCNGEEHRGPFEDLVLPGVRLRWSLAVAGRYGNGEQEASVTVIRIARMVC